jgi:hypothetical protein
MRVRRSRVPARTTPTRWYLRACCASTDRHTHTHTHTHVCLRTDTHVRVSTDRHTHTSGDAARYASTRPCTNERVHGQTDTRACVYGQTHTHVCVYGQTHAHVRRCCALCVYAPLHQCAGTHNTARLRAPVRMSRVNYAYTVHAQYVLNSYLMRMYCVYNAYIMRI